MSVDHLLIHTGTFQRPVTVPLGAGKFREDYQDHLVAEPCRVHAASGGDMTVAEKEKASATHVCYVRPGTDVHVGYRLKHDGLTYGVTVRLPPSKPHHLKLLLAEIQLTPSAVTVTGSDEVVA
jgi:hypothetical protein